MKRVEPQVMLLATTELHSDGLEEYLNLIGAPEWEVLAPSEGEALIEVMARACYKSFKPGLNPNVTKVREGNDKYLANIVEVGHGSVMEHASVSFMFSNVSRVFTHELVRHRVGTAMSQESLRFVRLTDLGLWLPQIIAEDEWAVAFYEEKFRVMEGWQRELAVHFGIEGMRSFSKKKTLTSAFRRLAPIGLATHIGWTANHRTIRHVLEMRTSPHAEEEIARVFTRVGELMQENHPNLYADYETEEYGVGLKHFTTPSRKV